MYVDGVYFVDESHMEYFYSEYFVFRERKDKGVLSALYLLGSMSVFRSMNFDNLMLDDIEIEGISGGERIIVEIARHLYTSCGEVNIASAMRRLDTSRRCAVIQALQITGGLTQEAFGGLNLDCK